MKTVYLFEMKYHIELKPFSSLKQEIPSLKKLFRTVSDCIFSFHSQKMNLKYKYEY